MKQKKITDVGRNRKIFYVYSGWLFSVLIVCAHCLAWFDFFNIAATHCSSTVNSVLFLFIAKVYE